MSTDRPADIWKAVGDSYQADRSYIFQPDPHDPGLLEQHL